MYKTNYFTFFFKNILHLSILPLYLSHNIKGMNTKNTYTYFWHFYFSDKSRD